MTHRQQTMNVRRLNKRGLQSSNPGLLGELVLKGTEGKKLVFSFGDFGRRGPPCVRSWLSTRREFLCGLLLLVWCCSSQPQEALPPGTKAPSFPFFSKI
ncbi:hypothetical protein VNO77_19488 [Canavalia gladiata]|uniref:Uncharacterized protein n=1 Tax=Canavalia gladiata TaxID=3824 RepID=A0AAN9QKI1_CANGL